MHIVKQPDRGKWKRLSRADRVEQGTTPDSDKENINAGVKRGLQSLEMTQGDQIDEGQEKKIKAQHLVYDPNSPKVGVANHKCSQIDK